MKFLIFILFLAFSSQFVLAQIEPKLEKVSICVFPSFLSSLVFIAENQGYFKTEGLETEIHSAINGKICQDELVADRTEFSPIADVPLAYLSGAVHNLKILASTCFARGVNLVVRKDSGITSLDDLKGKRIGILPGTISSLFLYVLMEKNNLTKDMVKIMVLQPPTMVQAIASNQVDAIVIWEPWISNAMSLLKENGLKISGRELYEYQGLFVTSDKTSDSKSIKVLRALISAEKFLSSNINDAIKILANSLKIDPEIINNSILDYHFKIQINKHSLELIENTYLVVKKYQSDFDGSSNPDFKGMYNLAPLKAIDSQRVDFN